MRIGLIAILTLTLSAGIGFGQPSPVSVAGSLRARLNNWDWFRAPPGDNNYAYSGDLLRLDVSQDRDGWDWNAEFAVPLLLGLPVHAIGAGPQQGALGFGRNYFAANG